MGDFGHPSGGKGDTIEGGGDRRILSSIPVKEDEELDEEPEPAEEDEEVELSNNVLCLRNLAGMFETIGLSTALF